MIDFSKRRIILFAILFSFVFIFLPILNCIPNHDVKEKFCDTYGLCTVDIYYSVFAVILEPNLCPNKGITLITSVLFTTLIIVGTYLLALIIDLLYIKYRDK